MKHLRYLSLFSGIGAAELAIQNVLGKKAKCVGFSEIDPIAISVYRRHFPKHKELGDIRKIRGRDLGRVDLIIGGSPCQGFSSNGKRDGMKDPRSKLFWEFKRLLDECKPRYFVLENVMMQSSSKKIISKALGTQPIQINSSICSAQSRNRLYWTKPEIDVPEAQVPELKLKDILDRKLTHSLTSKTIIIAGRKQNLMDLVKTTRAPFMLSLGRFGTLYPARSDGLANTVVCHHNNGSKLWDGKRWRLLHIQETERLQTFPAGWTAYGKDGETLSKSARHRLLGNAMTVKVIESIIKKITSSNRS